MPRCEHDHLGQRELPDDCLWGIHTTRAVENFPLTGRPVHPALLRAFGAVKLAAFTTNRRLGFLAEPHFAALDEACRELMAGGLRQHFPIDALQGGAGTATNLNVDEVLANRALQLAGLPLGDHTRIDPIAHVNLHQSTNDCFPTALHVAALWQLAPLQAAVVEALEGFQALEQRFAGLVKVGRTQLQDAVLTTLGRSMGAYADVLARDRWRVEKCRERLRVVNLGGTAIGTGLGAPRSYIFQVVDELRHLTGLPLARAENLVEATQNHDALVEVSGILKALASTLIKLSTDLRLLGSGPEAGLNELRLPARAAGSSIMPGKVNPIIPEAVTQAALSAIGHDLVLTQAVAMGNLELNPFLPLVADSLLTMQDLLTGACRILARHCLAGLEARPAVLERQVEGSTGVLTALAGRLGYAGAESLLDRARAAGRSLRGQALAESLLTPEEFSALISPESVLRLGSS